MKILALETSGQAGSVAVAVESQILLSRTLPPEVRSAQGLAPTIHRVLADVGWRPADLGIVAVTRGPGSFTGLRVGVTTAKVMAFALGCRLIAVDTLHVIARQASTARPRIWSVLDALRDQFFVAQFDNDSKGPLQSALGSRLMDRKSWLSALNSADDCLTGAGVRKVELELPGGIEIEPLPHWEPQATTVAKLAWDFHLVGDYADPWKLVPDYYRPSYADEAKPVNPTAAR